VKAVILAGRYGTRISEETGVAAEAMSEIGAGRSSGTYEPLRVHGITDFVICIGYKGYRIINEYS